MALLKGKQDQIVIPLTADIDADHGKSIAVDFTATIKLLPYEDAQAVLETINSKGKDKPSDETLVRRYVLDWDMPGPDGEKVRFSDAALAEALSIRGYRVALVEGVMQMLLGKKFMEAARRKN